MPKPHGFPHDPTAKKHATVTKRPNIVIDWKKVAKLCRAQCTAEEIAGSMGMCYDTLIKRCVQEQGTTFSDFRTRAREDGKAALRAAQMEKALDEKNTQMLIHLGEVYLDQIKKGELNASAAIELVVKTVTLSKPDPEKPNESLDGQGSTEASH